MSQPSDRYRDVARVFREASGDEAARFTPASAEDLAAAEAALSCRFPESYHWFQLEFGDMPVGPLDVYTVRPAEPPNVNIVGININERRDAQPALPVHLIAFSDSGGGDFLCFDTSAMQDGETPVVWWDHELDDDQHPEVAAPSFLHWIESELRERAEEDEGSLLDSLGHVHRAWMKEWFKKE